MAKVVIEVWKDDTGLNAGLISLEMMSTGAKSVYDQLLALPAGSRVEHEGNT
jgi:hypothetical protein